MSMELFFRDVITVISLQPYTTWPTYLIYISTRYNQLRDCEKLANG